MGARIGIRREDKNEWERRTPIVPDDVRRLVADGTSDFTVQPAPRRAFSDAAYREAGAAVAEDLSACHVVLGVKEMPVSLFRPGGAYLFFAHVIKGQAYNMPMLRVLLERGCHLLDYERIVDARGRRLVFFGRHAGLAGMIDSLWALGARLAHEGIPNPFERIRQARAYADLEAARADVAAAGREIVERGLPEALRPLVIAYTGYGNVSGGAQEIGDLLPTATVEPDGLPGPGAGPTHAVVKVVFREEDMVEPAARGAAFDLQDYYAHPEKYVPRFERHLPKITVLANCVYWDARYPRLVTVEALKALFAGGEAPRLRVIGDISCDVGGSVEATVRCTTPGNPVFVYEPATGRSPDGVAGDGPVILAVDNLPAELPVDASRDFSRVLSGFVPALAAADFSRDDPGLPAPLREALIVHRGALTPQYRHLQKHLGTA